jgi:DNA-binding CsgD family transcriptional regulator
LLTRRPSENGAAPPDSKAIAPVSEGPGPADVVRSRVIPAFYVVDASLRVRLVCGVPHVSGIERLPLRVERVVRHLVKHVLENDEGAIGMDGDTVVRLVRPYCPGADSLLCVIVERLRTRDPVREAVERYKITARETQVLRLLLQGASTALIAEALQIADTTAGDHIKRLAAKTSSHNRTQIVSRVLGFL